MILDKKTRQLGKRACLIAVIFSQIYFRATPTTWLLFWWLMSPVYFYFCNFGRWNIIMSMLMAPATLGLFVATFSVFGLGIALFLSILFSVLGVMMFFKPDKKKEEKEEDGEVSN